MDRNGYNASILQDDLEHCYLCGGSAEKLDRHEIYSGANRRKSKYYGLWVMLCHQSCHLGLAHRDKVTALMLKERGQIAAMTRYKWTEQDFINRFGRSYL